MMGSVKDIDVFEMPEAVKYRGHDDRVYLGEYHHYKGVHYEVVGFAKNASDASQELVIYTRADGTGETWVHTKDEFLEVVDLPGGDGFQTIPRFARVVTPEYWRGYPDASNQ